MVLYFEVPKTDAADVPVVIKVVTKPVAFTLYTSQVTVLGPPVEAPEKVTFTMR